MTEELPPRKLLVLDANILLRAVLGARVRNLLGAYEDVVDFYAPDVCFHDARRYIDDLATKRRFDPKPTLLLLDQMIGLVESVDQSLYSRHEPSAQSRIASRDPDDWPIVATALLLGCPIWTEDQDFFGSGIATWTTRTVEIYLRET